MQSSNLDPPVILIAEDEPPIQTFARILLEEEGYRILTAEDGEAALCVSRQYSGEIHVLLTDVVMPKMARSTLGLPRRAR